MFLPRMRASAVSRALFSLLGNRGYGWYLRYAWYRYLDENACTNA